MANQYKKVSIHIEIVQPSDMSIVQMNYTKAVVKILKNKLPKDPILIDYFIKALKEKL